MSDSKKQANKDKNLLKGHETNKEQEELREILDQISEQPAEKAKSPSRLPEEQVIKGPRGSKDNAENVEELLEKISESPGSRKKPAQTLSLFERLRQFLGI